MIQIEGMVERTELALFRPIVPVTSGCKNSVTLHLVFSKLWDAYSERYAVFYLPNGEMCRTEISDAGECVIPASVMRESGVVALSVIGFAKCNGEEGATVATERVSIAIAQGAESSEEG